MSLTLQLGLVYLISELLLTATRRSRSRTGAKQDRSTLLEVWLVILVSVAAGIYVAKCWPAAALPDARKFAFAGVVLFVAGLFLRWWAIVILGRFFTVDVMIEKDHELVERGPFRGGWQRFEAPSVQPYWTGENAKALSRFNPLGRGSPLRVRANRPAPS